ncbi:MAG: tetratricopeptide repeat protein [Candidatus Aminicenantales bacterium]
MKFKLALITALVINLVFCASTQKKIEESRKKSPRYNYSMGSFYLNAGNVDQAIKYFNKSLSLDPNYYLALNGLGLAYSMKGKFSESEKYFLKCLAINPNFSEARNNLGMVYQEMGLVNKAEQQFRLAASDKNYNSRELPYYNLARLYFAQDKLEEAINYVELALRLDSSMAMAYNLKGIILEKQNKLDEAIANYEKGIKIIPDDLYLNFNLAVAYFKNKELAKAKSLFEKISPKVTDLDMKKKIKDYLKMIKKSKQ